MSLSSENFCEISELEILNDGLIFEKRDDGKYLCDLINQKTTFPIADLAEAILKNIKAVPIP